MHELGTRPKPSRGDLFTILSNKDGHGRKGTIAATVRGTKAENLSAVFDCIPLEKRLTVREVTMDFSDSMCAAATASFPNAEITIDCFHVIQLATSALNEIRMKHKRQAMAEDARKRKEHKNRAKRNREQSEKRRREREAKGTIKSKRGRKPKRKNEAYMPPRFDNGDTAAPTVDTQPILHLAEPRQVDRFPKETGGHSLLAISRLACGLRPCQ